LGILFISHSGCDNDAAIKVRDWLRDHGWNQVFLDLDPGQGLAPGQRWQQELKQAGERCSGVLILLSPNWVASEWCRVEFLVADQLGKKIFPLFIAPTPFDDLPVELKAKFQIADISLPERESDGFERLAIGLKRAGLDPKSFEWPPAGEPNRSIYRGLQSLDEQDAAIFFGRDGQITEGLDTLRRMRDGLSKRMLVIQGASGAGKSSFLKAGLIARLKRDEENFLVLPVVRPERAALTGERGFAASLARQPASLTGPDDLAETFAALRAPVMDRLRRFATSVHESYSLKPPTVVIPVDQAEELFSSENSEAAIVLELLAAAIHADPNTIIVATIRTDAFARMQSESRLADVPRLPLDLSPLPHGAFKEVIEGPARLADPPLVVAPALTERLLKDLAADDALPLLAFTLERLLSQHRGEGTLTLAHYTKEMGGLQGAITAAVESAFAKAQADPALPSSRVELEKLARAAFIPALVQLDDADAEPRRRLERIDAMPESTRALVRHLVDERLLVTDRGVADGVESDTVEVVHEAILRQWPALKAWIAEERDALRALDGVRAAAAEWRKHHARDTRDIGQSWLAHRGGRLEEAENLMTRPDFAIALKPGEVEYLTACRAAENSERLRETQGIARTRRLQRNIGVLIAIAAAVVLLAGFGIVQILGGLAMRTSDTLAALAAKEADAGNYDRAARYALAGLTGADWPLIGFNADKAAAELEGASAASRALGVLSGHTDIVYSVAFSPNGKQIVTASADNSIRLWDAATARQTAIFRGSERWFASARFSPDGRRVVAASYDGTARVWDLRTFRQVAVMRGHAEFVLSAAFSPDGRRVVTASEDGTARIWDADTGRQLAILHGHTGAVWSAAFSNDGMRIVTASDDKTARIWDAQAAREIGVLRGHQGAVQSAAFSPDDKSIVTASADSTARIWNTATAQQIEVLRGHEDTVKSAVFSADGTRIVTASRDRTARIWDALTAREIATLRGHDRAVGEAMFSPDGTRIVTASNDGTARIWDARTGSGTASMYGHDNDVESAVFSPDGKFIATASYDTTARIWDAETLREIAVLRGQNESVQSIVFSPDGKRILTESGASASTWDTRTAKVIAVVGTGDVALESATFSPDGERIATASDNETATIWDANTSRRLSVLRGHGGMVASVAFSPNGNRIVTASEDDTARVWNARTSRTLGILRGHDSGVTGATFSPDGREIVTASWDKTARVWDATTFRLIMVLRGHEAELESAEFSPDGTKVVTASLDKTARFWNPSTGRMIAILRGHRDALDDAAFSPDGRHVVTASNDYTARIWNVADIREEPLRALAQRVCTRTLAFGLSAFTAEDLRNAPVLYPHQDVDACRPPSFWARLGAIFSVGVSR